MSLAYKNESGFSLLEVVIAATIMSVLSLGFAQMIGQQHSMIKAMENKMAKVSVEGELKNIIGFNNMCEHAFKVSKTNKLKYAPPKDINKNFIQKVPALYFGDTVAFEDKGLYENSLFIENMKLSRRVGVPIDSFNYETSDGVTRNVEAHSVIFSLDIKEMSGPFSGRVKSIQEPMNIYVEKGSNNIVTCNLSNKVKLLRASATRNGYTVPDKSCDKEGLFADVKDNPDVKSGQNSMSKYEFGQKSDVGSKALVGRCPVSVKSNTSDEKPDQIFKLRYYQLGGDPDDVSAAIGCNTANGWHLSGCTRGDDGYGGDSDVWMAMSKNEEYCHTNDFKQPHAGSRQWALRSVGLSIICTKYE